MEEYISEGILIYQNMDSSHLNGEQKEEDFIF